MKHFPREFDALDPNLATKRVSINRASEEELRRFYPRAAGAITQHMASIDTCESIRRRHQDNIWAIHDRRDDALIGIYAMAMLTAEGLAALLIGDFDPYDPRLSHVAETGTPVAAIYKWGVYAPGMAAAAIPLIAEVLNRPPYDELDLYGNASTIAGRRIMESVGFRKVEDPRTPLLYKYERLCRRGLYEITRYSL